jgi:hypothetical protein
MCSANTARSISSSASRDVCPNCNAELTEKTLVEPQGGIEVETMA